MVYIFPVVGFIFVIWLAIGVGLALSTYGKFENHKHELEISLAIVLFWPICVVALIVYIIIGAFKGLYYILIALIKKEN